MGAGLAPRHGNVSPAPHRRARGRRAGGWPSRPDRATTAGNHSRGTPQMPLGTAWPQDWREGHFALRIQGEDGPVAIALVRGEAFDMTPAYGTVSAWMNDP